MIVNIIMLQSTLSERGHSCGRNEGRGRGTGAKANKDSSNIVCEHGRNGRSKTSAGCG